VRWAAWLFFVTAPILGIGFGLFVMNAMSECLPPFEAGFEDCMSDKRRDAAVIAAITIGLWGYATHRFFRKREF
jgi:hypothetical protein|tara:strand:+ start:68 stop:289 length:222 start_codon:yes stop_codon:yes gene_type:complete